ncbi:hypothetical protein HJB77_03310 [Rhizobium lentis]|uniref:phage tail length tape measure family protein n=1 Tax=Rhizobium lentis TaxID=1138194 RepID=UPI001C8384E2|nr:phage tail length tape measure family protein [Rhizobium lentis]MBX5175324.1 hypothetical protein [Rhizobium lentis]
MTTKTLTLAIDPSGVETGGRVVRRVISEVAASATAAERNIGSLSSKSTTAMRVVGDRAQDAGREMKSFGVTAADVGRAYTSMANSITRSATLASYQQKNLVFQLNDVAVSLASGMSPLMVAIQQGSQIGQIYSGQGGVGRALKETASLALAAAQRFWPLAAAGAAVYGAYKLISSNSAEARNSVSETTKAMAEQAMSAGQLNGAISEYAGIRSQLIDAQGISGALNNIIGLQGNYTTAISNTGTTQTSVSNSVIADLSREYGAKRSLLEIEQQLQQAKLATLKADLAIAQENLRADIAKNFNTRPDLEAQGFSDPRVGRLTQVPGSAGGVEALQEYLKNNQNAMEVNRLKANLTLAEIAAEGLERALGQSFAGAVVKQGLGELATLSQQTGTALNTAAQGATGLGVAIGGIGNSVQASLGGVSSTLYDVKGGIVGVHTELDTTRTALQTAQNGVVNVSQRMAQARMATLSAYQQTTQQITSMKKELSEVQAVLQNAAMLNPSEIFGKVVPAGAAAALSEGIAKINEVAVSLGKGETNALAAHQAIEKVRASLIAMGANPDALNGLINSLVNGNALAVSLKGNIDQVSQSIANIPNRIIQIGIQQYTVPTSGGGTKSVNVLGGNADFSATQYSIDGQNHTVYGGNGSYQSPSFPGMVYLNREQLLAMTPQEFNTRVGIYSGETYWDYQAVWGYRAEGGPVSGGGTYVVGENGPELLKMSGPGQVTNTNSTAAILSGGRDTLSLIEDHLYDALQELRIHTNYFETYESDFTEMVACLKAVESGIALAASAARSTASLSYGSSGAGSHGGGGFSSSGYGQATGGSPNYNSIYTGPGITFTNGTGAIGYGTYNITPGVIGYQKNPGLHGFATGGQIMAGEDQRVEFFKRNRERVLIVDDSKVSDQRGGGSSGSGKSERPINLSVNFNGGNVGDARSRQAMADEFRRAVRQVTRDS